MTYRDDRTALEAQVASLERELREARDRVAQLDAAAAVRDRAARSVAGRSLPFFAAALVVLSLSLLVPNRWDEILPFIGASAILLAAIGLSRLAIRAAPNEALLVTGGPNRRIVAPGGIVFCAPWATAVALDVTPFAVQLDTDEIPTLDERIPMTLSVRARVGPSTEDRLAAIGTFGNSASGEVQRFVREHLSDAVRSIFSRVRSRDIEPEWDRLRALIEDESSHVLRRSGLVIDSIVRLEVRTRIAFGDNGDTAPELADGGPEDHSRVSARTRT